MGQGVAVQSVRSRRPRALCGPEVRAPAVAAGRPCVRAGVPGTQRLADGRRGALLEAA
jgi:hypothetical protein